MIRRKRLPVWKSLRRDVRTSFFRAGSSTQRVGKHCSEDAMRGVLVDAVNCGQDRCTGAIHQQCVPSHSLTWYSSSAHFNIGHEQEADELPINTVEDGAEVRSPI